MNELEIKVTGSGTLSEVLESLENLRDCLLHAENPLGCYEDQTLCMEVTNN
jgi:hypothetical protein